MRDDYRPNGAFQHYGKGNKRATGRAKQMKLFKAIQNGHLGIWAFIIWLSAVVIKAAYDSI